MAENATLLEATAQKIEPVRKAARSAQRQHLEVFHALDNLSSTDDSLATRSHYFIHVRGLHSHLADIGYRDGIDTHHSRAKSDLARVLRIWSTPLFEEGVC